MCRDSIFHILGMLQCTIQTANNSFSEIKKKRKRETETQKEEKKMKKERSSGTSMEPIHLNNTAEKTLSWEKDTVEAVGHEITFRYNH